MAGSENLRQLQTTTNRYSKVAGFAPITPDGGMGNLTENAILRALNWIEGENCNTEGFIRCPRQDQVAAAARLIPELDQTQIMRSTVGLNTFLTIVADDIGLSKSISPSTTVAITPSLPKTGAFVPPGASASGSFTAKIQTWWVGLPTWQQMGVGVAGLLAAMLVVSKLKPVKKLAPAAGTAGYRRR